MPSDVACVFCRVRRLRRPRERNFREATEKICATAIAVSGHECDSTHSKGRTRLPTILLTAKRPIRAHYGPFLFRISMTKLGHCCAEEVTRSLGCTNLRRLVWDRRVSGRTVRKEAILVARNMHGLLDRRPSPKGEQGYDIRNDQALSSLQTAINQKSAHRHRTMRLRQACLAGVAAYSQHAPRGLLFRFVQVASRHTTLS